VLVVDASTSGISGTVPRSSVAAHALAGEPCWVSEERPWLTQAKPYVAS
jgi:hypothetical protein